ncbi:Peptide-methionine (S)-S-oxide reductase [Arthrobotrys musiformis]|uniref:peptide-methionine (S)-S-oxide reductase n=1 Tax=Arthrobotrys musiformis TaxID=47236 RepID=A0AAV9VUN8_9PEZI
MTSFFNRLTRHFASSSSIGVTSSGGGSSSALPANTELATVAAGCFWGVEHIYRKHFKDNGLIDARVGYIGGDKANPSYAKVCGGGTGHAEALQITFDPSKVSYRTLIEFLYKIHDPTTLNRQGADVGTQYRSGIFYHSEEQKKIAEDVTRMANQNWWNNKISTAIIGASDWWDAEKYHQRYLEHNPGGYECPLHYLRPFKLPEGYPAVEDSSEASKDSKPAAEEPKAEL